MSPKAAMSLGKNEEKPTGEKHFNAQEWEEIFDAISDPIAIINKDKIIIKVNKSALKKLNLTKDRVIGKKCYEAFHAGADPQNCPCTKINHKLKHEIISQEFYDIKHNKTYLIDIYPRYNQNGAIKDFIHVLKDITSIRTAEENIRKLAITDFLTGVYNQRYFYYNLEKEIERSIRYNTSFSLILFDIDEFKHFNDKYGHVEGDNVLSKIGEIIRQNIRKIDSAYRYGGDEFIILMPQTGQQKAISIAKRLLESFRNSVFITECQDLVYKTLSIGITEFKKDDTLKGIINRVDKAMYKAKHAGGNKTFCF